jgi:hypothetical protein
MGFENIFSNPGGSLTAFVGGAEGVSKGWAGTTGAGVGVESEI